HRRQLRPEIFRDVRERRVQHTLFASLAPPAEPHRPDPEQEDREHQQREQKTFHYRTFPSNWVIRPRNMVAVTTPGSVIPSYGVFAAMLASSSPCTVHSRSGSTNASVAGSPTATGLPWSASRPIS